MREFMVLSEDRIQKTESRIKVLNSQVFGIYDGKPIAY